MLSANPLSDRKRWFDRPDTLMRVGLSTLASTFLILLVIRAFVVRARSRRATQLCLEFRGRSGLAAGLRGSRIRFLDRYELLLIIAVILSYGSVSGFLRAWRLPEGLVRILPLVTFGIGLVAKPRILRWLGSRKTAVGDGARQANAGVSHG